MKKAFAALLALILLAGALTACESGGEEEEITPAYPVTVGNVTIEERPLAVASLSPALTEMLLELGYQNRIVGYPEGQEIPDPLPEPEPVSSEEPPWWQFWAEEESLPSSDPAPESVDHIGTAFSPDLPMVGELKPEVIFTAVPLTAGEMEKLAAVGIQVAVFPPVSTVDELKNRYVDIIKIMEGQAEADTTGLALSDSLQASFDFIEGQTELRGKKTFLCVNTLDPLLATSDTYEGQLLSLIGENLASGAAYTVDSELLEECDPEIIFYADTIDPSLLSENAAFSGKTAVENGELIPLHLPDLLQETSGAVEALRELASRVYPGVDFTEPVPVEDTSSGEAESGASSEE